MNINTSLMIISKIEPLPSLFDELMCKMAAITQALTIKFQIKLEKC